MGEQAKRRVAVVGLGLIAQVAHLPALARLRNVEVSHLCDIAPGLAAKLAQSTPGSPSITDDWRKVIAASPDAVVLCTPGSHARLAEPFLRAGIAVLAEKPLALTVAEARRLHAIASDSGTFCEVGYMKAHDPVVAVAAERYRQLDDPRLVRATVLHPDDDTQVAHLTLHRGGPLTDAGLAELEEARAYEEARTVEAVGNSPLIGRLYREVLNGSVVHELALIRAVTAELPEWHWCRAETLGDQEPPCIQAIGRIGERTNVVMSWNWLPGYPDYEEELAVFANDGRMALWMEPPYTRRRTTLHVDTATGGVGHEVGADPDPLLRTRATSTAGYESSFDHQMKAFVDRLDDGPERNGCLTAADDIGSLQQMATLVAGEAGLPIGGEAAS